MQSPFAAGTQDNLIRFWEVNFSGSPAKFRERGCINTPCPMSKVYHTPLGDYVVSIAGRLDSRYCLWPLGRVLPDGRLCNRET